MQRLKRPLVSSRLVVALITTPFALFVVGLIGLPVAAIWPSKDNFAGFFVALIFSPIFTVPATLFLFVPICLVFRWMGELALWKCVVAGVFTALIFIDSVGNLPNPLANLNESTSLVAAFFNSGYPLFSACGAFSGAVFWLLGIAEIFRTKSPVD